MNQSVKSILALIVLISLGTGVFGWMMPAKEFAPGFQFWMRLSPSISVSALLLIIWGDFRSDKVPDFLQDRFKAYFERDGLCFGFMPSKTEPNFCWLIFFQNRYEKPCRVVISIRPGIANFGIIRPSIAELKIEIECEGAAFGVAKARCEIPKKYHGKCLWFDVAGHTHYPDGRGTMLRFKDGIRVGSRQKSGLDTALLLASGLTGHMHYNSQARFRANIPAVIDETAVTEMAVETYILWRPGMPVDEIINNPEYN